ncbi:hypothetical protein B9T11_10215 [Wohlfahrtiimonas chitiniclastica]|nr:hypothetical protein B9T11_10215 [Wohlfahrtiimonas chitiniclastica]
MAPVDYPNNTKYHRKLRGVLIDMNRDLFLIDKKIKAYAYHSWLLYDLFNDQNLDDLHIFIMALEDRRFLKHCGVDFKAFIREILKFKNRRGGASTIDMQLVRTITNFKDRTIFRKLYESILAIIINFKYTKREIIDCYISNAFFGSQINGLNQLLKVLNCKYSELSIEDKSNIAAMLQLPKPLSRESNKQKLELWNEKLSTRSLYAQAVRSKVKYCTTQDK